ncbi:ABC transporter ATP-binding protein [Streptosporangium lutulentum]|uniref:ATP-binding cassette subfamily B protein n=1 Tax=Streptosporangium lutulentum TaxID=1461250 RepID=A0ABT9QNT0_9ACTN|nr:ABC transporter ATP-binding protein [Streptosporangium lutulentum]MDP9848432.1 ATP-binding cassette subfamily B protein [Streptosporangium lutulentum]
MVQPPPVAPAVSVRKTFRQFWPYTGGVRRFFVVGVLFALVAAVCEVASIALFGFITDEVLSRQSLEAFWVPALAWLGLAVVAGLASFVGAYATAVGGERFLLGLRDNVFAHLQTLTPDFFDNRRLGDLMARLTDDIEAIEELVGSGLVRLFMTVASVVFFAGAAFYIRWDLALVTFVMVPAFLLVSKFFAAKFRSAAARERLSNGTMNSVIEESLANQTLVQAYNRQKAEAERLHDEGGTWLQANVAQARLSALYGPVAQVLQTICLLVILGVGAWEIVEGRLTIGGLLAFAAYVAYLYPAVQNLGQIALTVSEAAAGSDRVVEILRIRPTVTDRDAAAQPETRGRGRVEFADVGFTYPNRSRPTLRNLSFRADPGELIVCTGPSGAGKSTLAKLLLRFYDPDTGHILLDGVDIRDMSRKTLRENITILQQESLLFSGTVRDNIAYGRPEADMDDIVQAAIMADVHDFIGTLPQQYDTPLGQRGRLVSGGQRQRIAFARAILRDSPVLVLDEPMTGLDSPTAARIMEPLKRLMSGRTTILITHDLRLIPETARTIVLGPAQDPEPIRIEPVKPHGTPSHRV